MSGLVLDRRHRRADRGGAFGVGDLFQNGAGETIEQAAQVQRSSVILTACHNVKPMALRQHDGMAAEAAGLCYWTRQPARHDDHFAVGPAREAEHVARRTWQWAVVCSLTNEDAGTAAP